MQLVRFPSALKSALVAAVFNQDVDRLWQFRS